MGKRATGTSVMSRRSHKHLRFSSTQLAHHGNGFPEELKNPPLSAALIDAITWRSCAAFSSGEASVSQAAPRRVMSVRMWPGCNTAAIRSGWSSARACHTEFSAAFEERYARSEEHTSELQLHLH